MLPCALVVILSYPGTADACAPPHAASSPLPRLLSLPLCTPTSPAPPILRHLARPESSELRDATMCPRPHPTFPALQTHAFQRKLHPAPSLSYFPPSLHASFPCSAYPTTPVSSRKELRDAPCALDLIPILPRHCRRMCSAACCFHPPPSPTSLPLCTPSPAPFSALTTVPELKGQLGSPKGSTVPYKQIHRTWCLVGGCAYGLRLGR